MDDFYEQCDPDKENLCLYGNPDGTWEVQLPAEEVPPELPEPALGINFARDGMQVVQCSVAKPFARDLYLPPCGFPSRLALSFRVCAKPLAHLPPPTAAASYSQRKDWLALVAVHSDAWLMAVAFYYGAKFDGKERYETTPSSPSAGKNQKTNIKRNTLCLTSYKTTSRS